MFALLVALTLVSAAAFGLYAKFVAPGVEPPERRRRIRIALIIPLCAFAGILLVWGIVEAGRGVSSALGVPLVVLVVIVGVFLIIREFWCWYFKTNQILAELDEIKKKLGSH
jgi:quinol-cytochrome oxidoreductase complex cytochrome b subunit